MIAWAAILTVAVAVIMMELKLSERSAGIVVAGLVVLGGLALLLLGSPISTVLGIAAASFVSLLFLKLFLIFTSLGLWGLASLRWSALWGGAAATGMLIRNGQALTFDSITAAIVVGLAVFMAALFSSVIIPLIWRARG